MSGVPPLRRVAHERWLELALDPATRLELPHVGYHARTEAYATGSRTVDFHVVWFIERGRLNPLIPLGERFVDDATR